MGSIDNTVFCAMRQLQRQQTCSVGWFSFDEWAMAARHSAFQTAVESASDICGSCNQQVLLTPRPRTRLSRGLSQGLRCNRSSRAEMRVPQVAGQSAHRGSDTGSWFSAQSHSDERHHFRTAADRLPALQRRQPRPCRPLEPGTIMRSLPSGLVCRSADGLECERV